MKTKRATGKKPALNRAPEETGRPCWPIFLWPLTCGRTGVCVCVGKSVIGYRALSTQLPLLFLVSSWCRRCSCQKEEVYCFPDYLFHPQGICRMLLNHVRSLPGLLCGVEPSPFSLFLVASPFLPFLLPGFNTLMREGNFLLTRTSFHQESSFLPPSLPSFLPSLLPSFLPTAVYFESFPCPHHLACREGFDHITRFRPVSGWTRSCLPWLIMPLPSFPPSLTLFEPWPSCTHTGCRPFHTFCYLHRFRTEPLAPTPPPREREREGFFPESRVRTWPRILVISPRLASHPPPSSYANRSAGEEGFLPGVLSEAWEVPEAAFNLLSFPASCCCCCCLLETWFSTRVLPSSVSPSLSLSLSHTRTRTTSRPLFFLLEPSMQHNLPSYP